jgi:hypothetical protein
LKLNCPDVPELKVYTKDPGKGFWDKIPKVPLPSRPETKINIDVLEFQLYKHRSDLTECQFLRGKRLISDLRQGAISDQIYDLPGCVIPNSASTVIYGREVTDSIVSWLKKGFAAGPFESPPLHRFRSNSLLAIKQGDKVRTVVDLSSPESHSFNDSVNVANLEKVFMTSVKQFAKSLALSGVNAKMSKLDLVDAYKNVPCHLSELRLQGFCWLNRYFLETRQIFGAKSAVPNFDRLGNTIFVLALAKSNVPRLSVHRTLDDVPVISPSHESWGESFVKEYVNLCHDINIDVTVSCPKFEKAFVESCNGKVLGIIFDTIKFSWRLPEEKLQKTAICINKALTEKLSLKEFQTLMGRLNFAGQLSPFLQGFKFNLNRTLGQLQICENVSLSDSARSDLEVWANFILDSDPWHPLCEPHFSPPLAFDTFISDAAGCSENRSLKDLIGCGNIGIDCDGKTFFVCQLFWPPGVLQECRDSHGKLYGQKTTTLEFLGILVPFMLLPERMKESYVVVKVDNISCYYGWLNRQSAGEESASILIRTLHLLCSALCCEVHIEHLPRVSTPEASLVDRLSRQSSTTDDDRNMIKQYGNYSFPRSILEWMRKPCEDWSLPNKVLSEVLSKI